MLKPWLNALLDLIYPPVCPACRQPVEAHGSLCLPCLATVLCQREINLLYRKLNHLDSCHVLCDYAGGIKGLLHNIKYHERTRFAAHLGNLLETRLNLAALSEIDAVVPVPLHAARLASRGFNQTELIFRNWAQNSGLPWCEALVRVRDTEPQWRLELKERRKNVKGAFAVTRPELVNKKNILLVDDILTSGATINECAGTLKAKGAAKVRGLTLAGGKSS